MLKIGSVIFLLLIGVFALNHTLSPQISTPEKTTALPLTIKPAPIETDTEAVLQTSAWRDALWGTPVTEKTYPDTPPLDPVTKPEVSLYKAISTTPKPTTITAQTATESPEVRTLHVYGNTLGSILKTFYADTSRDREVLEGLTSATSTLNFARISTLGKTYTDLATQVRALTPPNTLLTLAPKVTDAYTRIGNSISALANSAPQHPPISAIQTYNTSLAELISVLVTLSETFKSSGVAFSAGEGGDMFYSK